MDINKSLLLQNPRLYTGSTTGLLESANNLSDVDDATTARENLGVTDEIETQNGYTLQRRMVSRVISDGATTNRARILTPGAIGNVAGLPITIEIEWPKVPESNVATTFRVCALTSSATSPVTPNNVMHVSLGTTGELYVVSAATPADYQKFGLAGFRTDFSGKPVRVVFSFTEGNSTTNPRLHINGLDRSSECALAPLGTPEPWVSANLVPTHLVDSYAAQAGDVPTTRVVIGAYSAAEAATWTAGGQRPAWAERAGTSVVQTSGTLTIGRRYYIKSYVASDSFTNVGAGSNATGVSFTATGTTPTTWTNSSQLVPLGLIDNPHPQPGLTTFDSLGRMSRRNVGHVNVTDRDTFTIYANTSESGNEQALGGALFESANNVTIDQIEQATATGTPTTTIGHISGGSAYKASGALSAGLNVFTPVTRKPGGTSVWVGSNDTTSVRTIIHGHKVSVPVS